MTCHMCPEPVLNRASRLNQQSLQTLPIVAGFPQRQSSFLCLEATNLAKDLCCLSAHLEHLVKLGRSILPPQSWHKLFALRYWATTLNRLLCADRQVSQKRVLLCAGFPQRIHNLCRFLSNCNFEYPITSILYYCYKNIITQFKEEVKPYRASLSKASSPVKGKGANFFLYIICKTT